MTQTLSDQLKTLDQNRMRAYRDNLAFYEGSQWATPSRKERQLTFNYVKVSLDKLTSYLMSGLDFAIDPIEEKPTTAARDAADRAEQAVYTTYQQNNCEALDFETEVDAAVLGDGCYKVTWDAIEKRVRITSPDVQGLFAWWQADDPSRVYRVAQRYKVPAEEAAARFGAAVTPAQGQYDGGTGGTKESEVIEDWTPRTYTQWIDGRQATTGPNPYGFIPFVVFPNLREPKKFWGLSDVPALTETAKELNRALSQLSRILEVSGNPIAVLENVEDSQDIAVAPNQVWNIPEGAKAYLLDLLQGGGIKLHVDYIDLLYRTLHDLAETPRAAFGDTGRELSGAALEIELHPLLQKVRRKRTIRTAAYRRRNEMTLSLLDKFTGTKYTEQAVTQRIVWGPVLPQDKTRNAQMEQLLVQSGIHSRRHAMDDMGIMDPDLEFDRWMEERGRIMEQNQKLQGQFSRGGQRERAQQTQPDGTTL